MANSYTYNAELIGEAGKDRMRFELGDTMVEGGAHTAYFTDEEMAAVIAAYPRWKMAKMKLIESVLHRFAYEVDTKTGPLELSLSDRFTHWQKLYDKVKAEAEAEEADPGAGVPGKKSRPPYFREGMHDNRLGVGRRGGPHHVPPAW